MPPCSNASISRRPPIVANSCGRVCVLGEGIEPAATDNGSGSVRATESLAGRSGAGRERAGSACDWFVNNACQPRASERAIAHATTLYTKMPDTLLGTELVSTCIWPHKSRGGVLYNHQTCACVPAHTSARYTLNCYLCVRGLRRDQVDSK